MLELLPTYERIENLKISLITKYSRYRPRTPRVKIYQLFRFVKSKFNTLYFFFRSFLKIVQIHKKERIHIINVPSYYYDSIPVILLRLIFKIPLFIKAPSDFETQQREIFMNDRYSIFERMAYYSWMKLLKKFLIKREKVYFQALNNKIYNSLIDLGVPRDNIAKIPNGISTEKYIKLNKTSRDHINFGFVGRLFKNKNIFTLLAAFNKYVKNFPYDKLLIYGKGPERQSIKDFIKKNQLSQKIELCGFEKNKLKIYRSLDALIHPSFGEGCPNTILEAALSQTFIIASNVSGINDIITDGENGLLFNPFSEKELLDRLYAYRKESLNISHVVKNAQSKINSEFDVKKVSKRIYNFLLSRLKKRTNKDSLTISILSIVFPYPRSGALPGVENYIKSIAVPLRKLGHKVKVITTFWNGDKKYDMYKGIPIIRISDSRRFLGKLGCAFHLNNITFGLNAIRKKNMRYYYDSDILIVPLAIGFMSFLRLKEKPIIPTFLHYDRPRNFIEFLTLPFYHYLERRQLKKHKKIITISETSKSELKKYYNINERKIKVLPIGVDTRKFNPKYRDSEFRKKYTEKILLYVGPIIFRKRIPVLLKAISYLSKEKDDFHLIVIGDGPLLDEYIHLASDLNVEQYCTFLGFVKDRYLPKYYASSDLFVFPSELEGFGQVLLEAMASGIPVLCANKPPMSKIVKNEKMLFETNNPKQLAKKIIEILYNGSNYKQLQQYVDKRVEEYNYFNVAKEWIKFINKNYKNI